MLGSGVVEVACGRYRLDTVDHQRCVGPDCACGVGADIKRKLEIAYFFLPVVEPGERHRAVAVEVGLLPRQAHVGREVAGNRWRERVERQPVG